MPRFNMKQVETLEAMEDRQRQQAVRSRNIRKERRANRVRRIKITAQVLNGATGEVREVIADIAASEVQEAVNKLFSHARKDDYYYRFLSRDGVVSPTIEGAVSLVYQTQTYWALNCATKAGQK